MTSVKERETSIKEQEQTDVAADRHSPYEYALYAGLVALVVGAAIAVAVVRGGEVAPSTAAERVEVVEPKLLNTEPWGSPNTELLAEILNPSSPAVTGGAIAPPSEVIMVEIGGFAIAEPWGQPDPELLASILDPEGAAFRAMEPTGEPSTTLLESILDPEGAAFRAMEPTGKPNYERLFSIVGEPYAEQAAGPR